MNLSESIEKSSIKCYNDKGNAFTEIFYGRSFNEINDALPGVTLGKNCVVAANSVVTQRTFPKMSL